jgi:hypothetical protein
VRSRQPTRYATIFGGCQLPTGTISVSPATDIQPLMPPGAFALPHDVPGPAIEGDQPAVEQRGEHEVVHDRDRPQRVARHLGVPLHVAGLGVDRDDVTLALAHLGAEVRGLVGWYRRRRVGRRDVDRAVGRCRRPDHSAERARRIALDVKTGKLRWYHQVHPHDIFDRDLVHTLIARSDGREIVVTTGKGAIVVGLDPETGKRLWSTPVGTTRTTT